MKFNDNTEAAAAETLTVSAFEISRAFARK